MENNESKGLWRQVYECRKCGKTVCRFIMLRDRKLDIPADGLQCIAHACKGGWVIKSRHFIPEG